MRTLRWVLWRLPFPRLELTATLLWPCAVGFRTFPLPVRQPVFNFRLFISRRRSRVGVAHKQEFGAWGTMQLSPCVQYNKAEVKAQDIDIIIRAKTLCCGT